LNEIGNIPPTTQGLLLHVLDEHKVTPMGSDDETEVNPLMIFATNANLEQMVEQGLFRNDLLKRLQFYQLHIPPLRERKEDIPLITDFLYQKICKRSESGIKPVIDKGVYGLLSCCELKGNVRELENMLRAAYCRMRRNHEEVLRPSHFCIFNQKDVQSTMEDDLTAECLTEKFLHQLDALFRQKQSKLNGSKSKDHQCVFNLPDHCEVIKKFCLQKAGGNKAKAAIELGITRKEYYKKK
jgi:transcriptional regulator with GAF, ATPase, and Fis domain